MTPAANLKAFHVHDGQGLALLRRVGIAVAFVTARPGTIAERRAAELGADAYANVKDKLGCVREIAQRQGIELEAVAFMGDDLADLVILRACGLAVAPANAHPWIRERVHWRTNLRGGARRGARTVRPAAGGTGPCRGALLA